MSIENQVISVRCEGFCFEISAWAKYVESSESQISRWYGGWKWVTHRCWMEFLWSLLLPAEPHSQDNRKEQFGAFPSSHLQRILLFSVCQNGMRDDDDQYSPKYYYSQLSLDLIQCTHCKWKESQYMRPFCCTLLSDALLAAMYRQYWLGMSQVFNHSFTKQAEIYSLLIGSLLVLFIYPVTKSSYLCCLP